MRIESMQIGAYGPFNRVQLGPLSQHLTIIHGPDESSTSTLQAFICEILFGFPAAEPLAPRAIAPTGRYGGRLVLGNCNGERYIIERYRDVDSGAAKVALPDGQPAGEDVLAGLLANITADLYRPIFVFGIDDLQAKPAPVETATVRRTRDQCRELRHRRDALDLEIQRANCQIAALSRIEQQIANDHRRISPAKKRLAGAQSRLASFEQNVAEDYPDPAGSRLMLEELRESWTRLQAVRRMTDVYGDTVARQRIPRSPWFLVLLMAGSLIPVALGTIIGQWVVIAIGVALAVLGMITLVIAAIARSRFETAQLQARLHLEITQREAEGRFLHLAMAGGVNPGNVEQEVEQLLSAQSNAGEERQVGVDLPDREIIRDERRDIVAEAREAVEELIQELWEDWQDWYALAASFDLPQAMHASPALAQEFIGERLNALVIEHRRLDGDIQQLESSLPSAHRQGPWRQLRDQIPAPTGGWSGHDVLHASAEGFQARSLREASAAFDAMTFGAYHQLIMADGREEIVALGRDGRTIAVANMSHDIRQQAMLALRLGRIESFGRQVQTLPVLVDDILAGFDRERATEVMRALARLASDHQVIMFTCHASTVDLARSISPGARLISLGTQNIASPAPIWLDTD